MVIKDLKTRFKKMTDFEKDREIRKFLNFHHLELVKSKELYHRLSISIPKEEAFLEEIERILNLRQYDDFLNYI